jgi:thiol-disulfide isomerase/thioredoxin
MTKKTLRRLIFTFNMGLAFILIAPVWGDIVQLNSGQQVKASVTAFSNTTFEARTEKGDLARYPASAVKRIYFEAQPTRARLETRQNGTVEGTILLFENSAFTIKDFKGAEQEVAAEQINAGRFGQDVIVGVEVITHGDYVDVAHSLVPGKINVVDFYADWCGPCRMVTPYLEKLVHDDRDIVLRKVDIVNWVSPVAKQYEITSIPHVDVYDRKGKLVGNVTGVDTAQIQQYVNQAKGAGAAQE